MRYRAVERPNMMGGRGFRVEELKSRTFVFQFLALVATHSQQSNADTWRMQVFSADKNLPFPCLPTNHHPTLCIVMMFCTVSSGLITAQLVFLASKVQYSDNRNIVTHFTLRSCTMLMVLSETNIYISCPEYWQQCPNIIEMSAAAWHGAWQRDSVTMAGQPPVYGAALISCKPPETGRDIITLLLLQ